MFPAVKSDHRSNPTLNFYPNKSSHVIPQSLTCYPKPSSWMSGRWGVPSKLLWLWTPPPHLILLPSIIVPLWYYGIFTEKNSVSIQLATNKTNTTCHSGLSQNLPTLPHQQPPHSLPHHMLVCSTTLFTFLLANYLLLSPVCLGAGRSVIGGISAIL